MNRSLGTEKRTQRRRGSRGVWRVYSVPGIQTAGWIRESSEPIKVIPRNYKTGFRGGPYGLAETP